MTVKNLTAEEKQAIGHQYRNKIRNQKQLARVFDISERSIGRVLQELGLSETLPRMTKEAHRAEQALGQYNLSFASLPGLLDGLKRLGITITNRGGGFIGIGMPHTAQHAVLGHQPIAKVAEDISINSLSAPVDTNTEPGDIGTPWRVSEHYAILDPGKKYLSLSIGEQQIKTRASLSTFIRWVAGSNITSKPVTKEQVLEFTMKLPEEEFTVLHSQIITARVARASNTHVQTAMLNLQQKVEANAKATDELRRK